MTSTIDFPCPAIRSGINVVVTPGDNILNCAAAWQNIAEELSSESETDDSDSGDNGAEINAIQRMNAASSPIVEETVRCEFEARGTREVPVNETGFVTEVLVYTDRQLKKRAKRSKKKIKVTHCKLAGQLNKKNVLTYALKKPSKCRRTEFCNSAQLKTTVTVQGHWSHKSFWCLCSYTTDGPGGRKIEKCTGQNIWKSFAQKSGNCICWVRKIKKNTKRVLPKCSRLLPKKIRKNSAYLLKMTSEQKSTNSRQPEEKKDGTSNGQKQKTTDDVYATFLKALATDQPNLLPAKALQLTLEHFPTESNPQRPSDLAIKSKFSYYKRCVKQKTNIEPK